MLKLLGDRPLGERDIDTVLRALNSDPVSMCMVAARVEEHGLTTQLLGGQMWSHGNPESSLCFSGANLIPLIGDRADIEAFGERAIRGARLCSSIVGRADHVLPLWDYAGEFWGPAREIRSEQPLMTLRTEPAIRPDPRVRRANPDDLDAYLPAAVDMFISEVGIDPLAGDGGRSYRRRIAALIAARRAFILVDSGEVIFKAEIGAMSRKVGQIQGVWVAPHRRGNGIGAAGTASVASEILATGRIPSLYVNSFNESARRAYRRVGFGEVGTFATVLVD